MKPNKRLRIYNTYEELKLIYKSACYGWRNRIYNTYEELKLLMKIQSK